ncbi:hypothetical protein [Streptomyces sp. NPDC051569]|uniref:hypothetical protein n=1 Tax=Streptomyces sp. NPDC051569 TaxID=3365661 RepID=UPI003795AD89
MSNTTLGAPADAATELTRVFRAACLRELTVLPTPVDGGETANITLSTVGPETALQLARLLRNALTRTHRVADALRDTFEGLGLDVPDVHVENDKVLLGSLSLSTADQLATLLGAHGERGLATDAEHVTGRLCAAFKTETGGVLRTEAVQSGGKTALLMKAIDVNTARHLLMSLQFGTLS